MSDTSNNPVSFADIANAKVPVKLISSTGDVFTVENKISIYAERTSTTEIYVDRNGISDIIITDARGDDEYCIDAQIVGSEHDSFTEHFSHPIESIQDLNKIMTSTFLRCEGNYLYNVDKDDTLIQEL